MLGRLKIWVSVVFFIGCCATGADSAQSEAGRPNIVVILADDMGFSDLGIYGGEVETPNVDRLGKEGLRYTQFYNNARCCPTRASLMTGLYPHQAGMGWMTAADLGTPAYQGELNQHCVTMAEVLKSVGYRTYMSGKWHLSRERNNRSEIKTHWPSQRGFDRFYGIVGGGAHYFTPTVYEGNESHEVSGLFYLTHALSDHAVEFIEDHHRDHQDEPFFLYLAYTAPHWPLHALQRDIEKYKAVYRKGWDALRRERLSKQKQLGIFASSVALSERDPKVPSWTDLDTEAQEEFVMRMAIYAAQIDAMDQGVGRVVQQLKESNEWENTILFFLSDNGACAEYISRHPGQKVTGQGDTWESYRINWANLSSTPYREYKHWIHEGGIATPLIVHWPAGVQDPGGIIREPGHIVDIYATCVELAGAHYPEKVGDQSIVPLQGQSLSPHFRGEQVHRGPIFWEHEANIGVRDGSWKLVAKTPEDGVFDPQSLELYQIEDDPSELRNLVRLHPDRVQKMFHAWQVWADQVGVVLDTREYGHRARDYQRQINGEFENSLAGWRIDAGPEVRIRRDDSGKLSGKHSLSVEFASTGSASMRWSFPPEKGDHVVTPSARLLTLGPAHGSMAIYNAHTDRKIAETSFDLATGVEKTIEVECTLSAEDSSDRCELRFEFSGSEGTSIWMDGVSLY